MKGYEIERAVPFMLPKLDKSEFKPLAARADELLREAIKQDFAYMHQAGVLTDDGMMGNAYYDDDDAFEFLLESMSKTFAIKGKASSPLGAFIEQYMDLQQQFLDSLGMLDWD